MRIAVLNDPQGEEVLEPTAFGSDVRVPASGRSFSRRESNARAAPTAIKIYCAASQLVRRSAIDIAGGVPRAIRRKPMPTIKVTFIHQ